MVSNTTPSGADGAGFSELGERLRGDLLRAGDSGFDDARRLWNAAAQSEPAAIARCTGPADVMEGVNFARDGGVDLSVKAGGHMTTGDAVAADGLVLDLSPMNGVRVDRKQGTVRVGGGAIWEAVNREALIHDLIPPGIPETAGVGGFTVGGGMGVTCREHGLACDNLREVDIVTADGELRTASEDEHADLFWAIRGGGGNFGVVTSFEFECVEASRDCLVANLLYPIDDAEDYLRYFREAVPEMPESTWPIASLLTVPESPDIPADIHGELAVSAYAMGVGEQGDLADAMESFAAFGEPYIDPIYPADYTELYAPFAVPTGQRHHWMSVYLDELSDDLIETLAAEALPMPTPLTGVSIYSLGGEINRVPTDATAYPHRDAQYLLHITTHWTDGGMDSECREWTRDLHASLRDHGTGGEYINNQTDSETERVRAAYGDNYDRLAAIKQEWDPDNVFRMTQNIEPGS